MPHIYLVTGTPGTGKTTISNILSTKIGAKHIELSVYAQENHCIIEEDKERDTHVVDMVALRKVLIKELEGSETPLIIDGHYSHDLLYEEEASCVFVLRKAPWELQTVLQERLYSYEKVWENLEAEIMGVIAEEARENFSIEVLHEVDTTGKKEGESVVEMQNIIEGESVSFKPIDWITFPETLRVLVNRKCTL